MKRIAVIGAGAAGLMAAYAAASGGAHVTVFEKNEKPGKKIYITGKGRCNVTNACDPDTFFQNIVSNPKFMYKSYYSFSNRDLINFIEAHGTPLKVERGNRVFPVSDHSSDITRAFINACSEEKVNFKYNKRVNKLITKKSPDGNTVVVGLRTDDGDERFDAVILACGGATYPGAGGCRDGYEFAKRLGIPVKEISPSLVPFILKEDYIKELQGLSLKNVTLSVKSGDKTIYKEFGELLFTHFGISGPIVLTASAKIGERIFNGEKLSISIDLKPAIPDDELKERLLKIIDQNKKKQFSSFFDSLLPKSLRPIMVRVTGIDPEKRICDINKNDRKLIFRLLREFPGTITGLRGFSEAIVTRGGVIVKNINPKTMECKLVSNLYICGELLDVDALTGGFNLQCAFSTGFAAGIHAANMTIKERL